VKQKLYLVLTTELDEEATSSLADTLHDITEGYAHGEETVLELGERTWATDLDDVLSQDDPDEDKLCDDITEHHNEELKDILIRIREGAVQIPPGWVPNKEYEVRIHR
jgi:hypothetical protein